MGGLSVSTQHMRENGHFMLLKSMIKGFAERTEFIFLRFISLTMCPFLFLAMGSLTYAKNLSEVALYGTYEASIDYKALTGRDHPFRHPFYGVELEARFSSPSGRQITWWGFFDGDGKGGQDGNIWKIRFMPDELGEWKYNWKFSKGTLEGKASFFAVDTARHPKKPGPLRHDPDIHQWLITADGERHVFLNMYKTSFIEESYFEKPEIHIQHLKINNFDIQFISGPTGFRYRDGAKTKKNPFPFLDTKSYTPRLKGWHYAEARLYKELYSNNVYLYDFLGFYGGNSLYDLHKRPVFLQDKVIKYWLTRTAPNYIFIYNIGFELPEFVNVPWWVEDRARFIKSIDPWDHLITAHELHDWSYEKSTSIDFSALQNDDHFHERGLAVWNSPSEPHPHCNECIWNARWQESGTEASHRKDLWDGITAGMSFCFNAKNSEVGLSAFRHANAFLKSGVKWWTMSPHDEIVLAGTGFALANPGIEYIIYSSSGQAFTLKLDSDSYRQRWFDPSTGEFSKWSNFYGDTAVQFKKPDIKDWVLHIQKVFID